MLLPSHVQNDAARRSRLRLLFLRTASALSVGIGALTLLGWAADLPRLTDIVHSGISMFAVPGVCAILCGASIHALSRAERRHDSQSRLALCFGLVTALIGAATLFEHGTSIDLGIDTLIFERPWGQRAAAAPMRMGVPASGTYMFLGLAFLLAATGRARLRSLASMIGALVLVIAMLSLVGYAYSVESLFALPQLTGISLQTALLIAILAAGIIALIHDRGISEVFSRSDAAGVLVRRLALPIFLLPILLGAIKIAGHRAGYFDLELGTAVRTVLEIAMLGGLVLWTARGLSRLDAQRRATEVELDQQTSTLRAISDTTSDLISVKDRESRLIFANPAALAVLGLTEAEALKRDSKELYREGAERDAIVAIERRVMESGAPLDTEEVHSSVNGARTYLTSRMPMRDAQGTIVGIISVSRDISDRKREAEAMRHRERTQRLLADIGVLAARTGPVAGLSSSGLMRAVCERVASEFHASRAGLSSFDMEAGATIVSDHANMPLESIAGRKAFPAHTGPHFVDMLAGRPVAVEDVKELHGASTAFKAEMEALSIRSYLSIPLRHDGRLVACMWLTYHEARSWTPAELELLTITAERTWLVVEQARVAVALRESEDRLRLAAATAQFGVHDHDIFAERVVWTEALREIMGVPEHAKVTLGTLHELLHPDDRQRIVTAMQKSLDAAGSGEFSEEFRILRADDHSTRWVLSRSRTFFEGTGSNRRALRNTGIVTDITDRKDAEKVREELLESERIARGQAEEASRMKDDFLATLSHELRTPLNAIIGWCQVVAQPAGRDKTDHAMKVILRNARAQADLISDLLDLSRITSGKVRLNLEPVLIGDVVSAAVDTIRPTADEKEIRITLERESLDVEVQADQSRLQQVLWNLLSNAVKFTPRQGSIRVFVTKVNSRTRIVVQDTGSGVSPSFLPYLFDRFRQGDSSAARQHGGMGIGLAIVKHLVELHGGHVSAASAGEGQGTTFTVDLPVLATPELQERVLSPMRPPDRKGNADDFDFHGLRILLVDDQSDTRLFLQRLLEERRASVVAMSSADEGLAALREESFDLILCDLSMPMKDGFQFARELRVTGNRTPALAVSALAREEDKARASQAGFCGHVSKPLEVSELFSSVKTHARRNRDDLVHPA